MAGFDLFRTRRVGYVPRTAAASLKAVGAGMFPAEYFIHASTSAKPLDEEPLDRDEIERVLARPGANLATSILLKRVLTSLIGDREQEIALFGAEGINALESRALSRIEALKGRLLRHASRRLRWRLARALYELAEFHAEAEAVRRFYLREAYAVVRDGFRPARITRSELVLATDILVALGQHDSAARLLERVHAADDPGVLLLAARVAFHRRDYVRVAECCRRIGSAAGDRGDHERRAVTFWAGGNG